MWWMCGGGYNIAYQNSMDHDHETLKVALDIKKAELQTLSEKLAKAEAVKFRSPLVTAGSLVRSSLSSEEPIWVKGLDYPAQYVVRHTRSMSQHTPHKEIVEFDLPEHLTGNVETLKATKTCKGATTTLKLASVIKLMGGGDLVALLHCGDMVAVVLHSSFILCSQTDRLQIEWQQQCVQDGVLCGALSIGGGWTLLALAGLSVRTYLYSDHTQSSLRRHHNLISGSAHSFSCVCCWYVSTSFRVAALTKSCKLLTWTLQLSDKQWTVELQSQIELVGGTTHSMVHVQGSQLLALLTDTTLYLMQGEHIKGKYSLTCAAVGSSHGVRIVWACVEEGQVFCVLCAQDLWSVVLLGQTLRELSTHHLDGVRSVHVRDHQLMIALTDCGVSCVFRLDRELFRATVSGLGQCVCEWTVNGHLLVLTTSGLLCDFIEP